jgi:hypothetical protein
MKQFFFFLLSTMLITACTDSGQRPAKSCATFDEFPDPNPDTTANWSAVSLDLNVSFGSIDKRYAKSSIPVEEKIVAWTGSGWCGERVSAQIVLWSSADIDQVECEFTPFRSGRNKMKANIAQARFVRYVMGDERYIGCGHRKPGDVPFILSPDILDDINCFNLEANTTRPVWLTFDIPSNAKPGVYTATLKIHARSQETQTLNINLEVLPQTLPPPKDWKFHLDLWQHPTAVARINGVDVWSDEHFKLMEAPMKMLANAGQKVITTTINKEPWNSQCYDDYADMIFWTKNADGTWTYNYTIFDRWVSFMMNMGITQMINCYSIIPWNNEVRYFDAATQQHVDVSAKPGTEEFTEIWRPFLTDFREHLRKKGWLNITNIAMDERSPEEMKAALELLQKVVPEFGVSFADNHKSYKEYPFLKDICIEFGSTFEAEDLAYRKQKGLISTFYVCCWPGFPNTFTFSPPAESTYLGWYAAGVGLDGFLRWAYNSWIEDPVRDARFRSWASGDPFLIYPGPRSSIRFERLREGIQDFEKIRILREQFEKSSPEKLARLNEAVAVFNTKARSQEPTGDVVRRAQQVLEELSR